jgi:hypothetical protein
MIRSAEKRWTGAPRRKGEKINSTEMIGESQEAKNQISETMAHMLG